MQKTHALHTALLVALFSMCTLWGQHARASFIEQCDLTGTVSELFGGSVSKVKRNTAGDGSYVTRWHTTLVLTVTKSVKGPGRSDGACKNVGEKRPIKLENVHPNVFNKGESITVRYFHKDDSSGTLANRYSLLECPSKECKNLLLSAK